MNLTPDLALVEAALDRLERLEVRVLVWGLVDSALSQDEVHNILREVFDVHQAWVADPDCTIDTEGGLRQRLIDLGHLIEVPGRPAAPARFRTRMAEGVRLFARLRQLFPNRHAGANWVGGATLVADFRLLWRQRKYPDRNLTAAECRELIAARVSDPRLQAAVKTWFDAGSPNWKAARFQIDAATRILEGLSNRSPRGTLVSAGTGSGKTLAFYLPALTWLCAERKASANSRGVRVLALYPRNELLKDQLSEIYQQARKFDQELGGAGTTLSIGVFFGDTPHRLSSIEKSWRKTQGYCPFFRCPKCNGDLRYDGSAPSEEEGYLSCRCGERVESRQLRFTRLSMIERPPDILFTSVEMMNQRLSDSEIRHLFGLGPKCPRSPALMLLDEVHLYTGTFGAQVAHLLRRWSHLSRRQTQFVGLSATISDGAAFFSSLVGLDRGMVEEIAPNPEHMKAEGAEYLLALRGDPVSQASLLSTSIQSLMLASRLLDRRERFERGVQPFAGWRSFAFTDQVDATNRLFYDLRDAEGFNAQGIPATARAPNGGLAHLRRQDMDLRRYEGGQDWRALEANGHNLTRRHHVARTTSLDTGVSQDAEIVVATAALEVGYDDPAVGVVLQHKAPRDLAQFLQRKGRAGRTRHMRPWTIMVLSDYGRDRLAYQAYEQFFDPELPPRELPLSNRYVRRMQATYALIDYLGVAMQQGEPEGSIWRDFAKHSDQSFAGWPEARVSRVKSIRAEFPLSPSEWRSLRRDAVQAAPAEAGDKYSGSNWLQDNLRRKFLVARLAELLKDPARTDDLARYLSHALALSREDVDTLLWEHPRPLLLTVIPTALRRIATNWRAHGQPGADRRDGHPLPEFVPGTLFSDLALPEVKLLGGRYDDVALPVLQALNELAPGKVSRRLDDALWIGLTDADLDADVQAETAVRDVDVSAWYDLDPQFSFHQVQDGVAIPCSAWRPRAIRLTPVPRRPELLDSSNARLSWRSQLIGRRAGNTFDAPGERVGIASLVHRVVVHTHASQSAATVRRYAIASNVGLRIKAGANVIDHVSTWQFTKAGLPCGVGFEVEADALCFVMNLPTSPSQDLLAHDPAVLRAARTARFLWEAQHGSALASVTRNVFFRKWLAEVFTVAAIALAQTREKSLAEAIDQLRLPVALAHLRTVLETIFQSLDAPDDDHAPPGAEPRLRSRLIDAYAADATREALATLAQQILVAPIDASWDPWLRRAQLQTFAAALVDAIQQACPQVSADDLMVDTEPGPTETGELRQETQLWITEANPGGNGLIEQVVEAIATRPDHFYRRIEAALEASEFEQIDLQMRDFVERIGGEEPQADWVEAALAVRGAASTQAAQQSLLRLRQFLADQGHAVFHGYISALSSRLLRPGSPQALDRLLAELLHHWAALEARLGIEVDARVVCAVFSGDARLDAAFVAAGFELPLNQIETWRFSMLSGVVWARGHALRAHALPVSERFAEAPMATDRLFLSPWLSKSMEPIAADAPDLLEVFHGRLRDQGRAVVKSAPDAALVHRVISMAATVPVQLEYLNVYPRLTSAVRAQGTVALHFELETTA